MEVVETSSKTGLNINQAFEKLTALMLKEKLKNEVASA